MDNASEIHLKLCENSPELIFLKPVPVVTRWTCNSNVLSLSDTYTRVLFENCFEVSLLSQSNLVQQSIF